MLAGPERLAPRSAVPEVSDGVGGGPVADLPRRAQGCGFCAAGAGGACIAKGGPCPEAAYSDAGCPSPYTPAIIACVLLYLAAFSPGLGPVPWAVNSEIYPLQARPAPPLPPAAGLLGRARPRPPAQRRAAMAGLAQACEAAGSLDRQWLR